MTKMLETFLADKFLPEISFMTKFSENNFAALSSKANASNVGLDLDVLYVSISVQN